MTKFRNGIRISALGVLLLSATMLHSQVIVKGKIHNYDGKSIITYRPTLEGVNTAYVYSFSVSPSRQGNFSLKFQNEGLATLGLSFNGIAYSFVHDGNSEILLEIDQNKIPPYNIKKYRANDAVKDSVKREATIFIGGKYSAINNYYNGLTRSHSRTFSLDGNDLSRQMSGLDSKRAVVNMLDSAVQNELLALATLEAGLTTEEPRERWQPELKKYLVNQIYMYYGNVFLTALMIKHRAQSQRLHENPQADLNIYTESWAKLVEDFLAGIKGKIDLNPDSFEAMEFILNSDYVLTEYKQILIPQYQQISDDELVLEKLLRPTLRIDSIIKVDSSALLAYRLHNIQRFISTQTYYTPTLLNAIRKLQSMYPESVHLKHFDSDIHKLNLFLESASKSYEHAVVIENNFLRFEDLIEQFKGKNVLVDIWATWCPPCVDDFAYKSQLQPLIQSSALTVLYISLDKADARKRWQASIKNNQLQGYHFLADDVFKDNMWKYLGGNVGVIPRYVLIDKEGKLFMREAPRMAEGVKLMSKIKELTGLSE